MPPPVIIYDFGANNGDDIAYYLHKADRVVAVEANPALCDLIRRRYAAEVAAGRVVVENVVVVPAGQPPTVPFYIHKKVHVLSQFGAPDAAKAAAFAEVRLPALRASDVVGRHGQPHYIKIDLERLDAVILRDLFHAGIRPDYISAECHEVDVFPLLAVAGYDAFKLVDGKTVATLFADHPIATRNGLRRHSFPRHAAGPFGNDIPGPWLPKAAFFKRLAEAGLGWKDVHASRVDPPAAEAAADRPATPPARPEPPRAAAAATVAAFGIAAAPPGSVRIIGLGSCSDSANVARTADAVLQGAIAGELCLTVNPALYMTADGRPLRATRLNRIPRDEPADTAARLVATAAVMPEIVHDEPALLLSCTWDSAFYHFLYDVLGKLAVAELYGIGPRSHAVYFNVRYPWQGDVFRLLGIEPRSLQGGVRHRFRRAVLPSYYCTSSNVPPCELLRFLRRLRPPLPAADQPAKLFLSRNGVNSGRHLVNEHDLFTRCFQPRGYRLVDPGLLPFDEQRGLFSSATHLAGPHGAAFSLVCLTARPPTVVEFHSPHYFVPVFSNAAVNLGGRAAAFNARQDFWQTPRWKEPFSLDLDRAARWLDSLPPEML
jgi:FkbM family methyltransferase